jgi:hypothetical protein
MVDELIKVDPIWFRDFVLGGPGGLKGWFSTIALVIIAWGFKTTLTKTNYVVANNKESTEDNTDSMIELTKAIRSLEERLNKNENN